MKTFIKKAICLTLCASMSAGVCSSLVGCKDKGQQRNPEEDALVFALGQPDGNFNPFFSTSAMDVEVIGLTQIGMLTTDENGKLVYGENQATVALDYTKDDKAQTPAGEAGTRYEFLIKNNLKFSDGTALTIKDVLFNLYAYLDPAYSGSATIYSTDIYGLKEYRTQDTTLGSGNADSRFVQEAYDRMNRMIWLNTGDDRADDLTQEQKNQIYKDVYFVMDTFYDEIVSDWNNVSSADIEEEYPDFNFTEAWEAYYYNEGLIKVQTATNPANGKDYLVKDTNEKYLTTLDDPNSTAYGYKAEMEAAMTDEALLAVYTEQGLTTEQAQKNVMRDTAIAKVYTTYCADYQGPTEDDANHDPAKGSEYAQTADLARILTMFSVTPNTVLDTFEVEQKKAYFDEVKKENAGKLVVPYIKGITTRKTKSFNGVTYTDDHYVLSVLINGVDPKAIYNFSFGVAPLSYYSTNGYEVKDENGVVTDTVNYISDFDGHDLPYDTLAAMSETELAATEYDFNFGVSFGDNAFFEKVIKADAKTKLPKGAGPYMASNQARNPANVTGTTFYNNGIVYYERNPYFETLGSGISNAKIKYFKYQVTDDAQILNSLIKGAIHYGQPNGKQENIDIVKKNQNLAYETYDAAGYGYVGINPKAVPDLGVRRAIMLAMNKSWIYQYYKGEKLVSMIDRPMSKTSWAYPFGSGSAYTDKTYTWDYKKYTNDEGGQLLKSLPYNGIDDVTQQVRVNAELEQVQLTYDSLGDTIQALVEAEGWKLGDDGIYIKEGKPLEIKFTIAGQSDDHPAATMFLEASTLLNELGFKITVAPDVNALNKLATGGLEVWAAAWSSALDPDMYQVYHKDSKATSVNNWAYSDILNTNNTTFDYEREVVYALSDVIDAARDTTNEAERIVLYKNALDLVMELSVEFPTYQRCDLAVYNKTVLDTDTLNLDNCSHYAGVMNKIWEVNYN